MAKRNKGVSADPVKEAEMVATKTESAAVDVAEVPDNPGEETEDDQDPRIVEDPEKLPPALPALWALYVARVGQADLIHTVRRDARVIFREAFLEAKVALDVFNSECNKE